jgi:NitT/TauT family transport system substrate-binding protein
MSLTPIRITCLRHSAFYSPLLYTIRSGLLEAEGLAPSYAPSTPERPVAAQLLNGEAHLSQSAVAASFSELEAGKRPEIVHFAQINERDGFFLHGRGAAGAFQWEHLAGKEVLVDHLFQPLAMLKYACHKRGVDFAALRVIDAGQPDEMEKTFRSSRGDFVHMQGPGPQQLEHEGVGTVAASVGEAVGPVAFSSLCATRSWLQTDMARAFMRAYRKGRRATTELPATKVAEVVQPFFPEAEPSVLSATVAAYQAMGTWGGEDSISEATYDTLLEVFAHSGLVTKRHPYSSAIEAVVE